MTEVLLPDIVLETEASEVLEMRQKIAEVLAEAGVDIEKIAPRIVQRLMLLNSMTKTVEDGRRAVELARTIFAYYDSAKQDRAWSEIEKKVVSVGSIFSDIGKTGPLEATPEQQLLITQMFGVENVKDPKMSVRDFFIMYFQDTAEERIQMFAGMNLDPEMTMREFWNLHSLWTLHIISNDGVPQEAIAGAAMHHIIEGINPDGILGDGAKFNRYFGENASFDRPEKLVIILDKFDAFVRRSSKTKKDAIEAVRAVIGRNENFANDQDFQTLLDDLLHVVSVEE